MHLWKLNVHILSWTTPGLWQTGLSLPDFQIYDCSNMCNCITLSSCFIRLQLKCKDHPSLSIPSPCSSLTLHFKNRRGPKLIILSQKCFQNSKNFHTSLTESLQTENYGEIQSPRSSCAGNSLTSSSQSRDCSELSLKSCQSCSSSAQVT